MYMDCVGMMRSGSTLQYNIVAEILELKNLGIRLGWEHHNEFFKIKEKYENKTINVFKNHFLTSEIEDELKQEDGSTLIYVYRDIRDVCVSLMEKENKTFDQIFNSKVLHKAIEQYEIITKSSLKKYIQSYEIMFLNTHREVKQIASFLNIELTAEEISKIYNLVSFESQKENINKYKEKNDYILNGNQNFNETTLLHLNHIKDGGIGKFKKRLSKVEINTLENEFGEWLELHGYKCKETLLEDEPQRKYYSQHGEDYLLWKFFDFKPKGFFIEVGAFDGIHLSNTNSFELEGWNGICIEPGQYFNNCKKNRPNSLCINAACVSNDDIKEITFYEEELGLLSSLDMSSEKKEDIEKRYKNRELDFSGHKERTVKAQTLNSILENNNVKSIDFITIDVEGAEIDVLKGFDLNKYQPSVVILEANDNKHKLELIEYMTVHNKYILVREVSVNLIFIHSTEGFEKMKDIQINCTIEKQVHPLGINYTINEYLYGLKYFDNNNIMQIVDNKNQELIQKKIEIEQKNKKIEQKSKEIEQKSKEIEQKSKEIEQKSKEINKLNIIYEEKDYNYSCLMDNLNRISRISVKTNPIEKYKQYRELLSLYAEFKGQQ